MRNDSLIIWGRKTSFNVQKVLWLAAELNLSYQHIPAGGKFGGLDTPEFLAMNPHGRIPVLKDQESIVWESHTILRYLAAQYGAKLFWFGDARTRAPIEAWMDWSQTTLQPDFLTGVFWGYYRTPEAQRDWPAIKASIELCNKHFNLLNNILKKTPYLAGNTFSLADIPAGTTLYRYYELDIERPFFPYVEAWYQRLQQRPAYSENVMIEFSEMRGKLTF